jgi:hypothetical protein
MFTVLILFVTTIMTLPLHIVHTHLHLRKYPTFNIQPQLTIKTKFEIVQDSIYTIKRKARATGEG